MPFLAAIPVITGAVAATSMTGMLLLGSAAIGTLGMLTGNENLTKIGGFLGLAGGISGLASGAFSGAASGAAEGAAGTAVTEAAAPTLSETVASTGMATQTPAEVAGLTAGATGATPGMSSNIANLGTGYEGLSEAAASGNWGAGGSLAPPTMGQPASFIEKWWAGASPLEKAEAMKMGGGAVKGAFSALTNSPEKRLAALREKQFEEELKLKANQSKIPAINFQMSPQASLYYKGIGRAA